MNLKAIHERIQLRLKAIGLSANAVSMKATDGENGDLIRNIKRSLKAGREGASILTLNKIAKALGVTETWLISGEGPMETVDDGKPSSPITGPLPPGAQSLVEILALAYVQAKFPETPKDSAARSSAVLAAVLLETLQEPADPPPGVPLDHALRDRFLGLIQQFGAPKH